ncbi:hypothetical protein G3I59_09175 [Amycolatopsis rubida]|uniref:DUF2127 domain-containing protein n=1 Tax=Amycolatopsis rubida TaxID=112413 RepID=A0ABX0BQ86_9PSEU|nr:MULTISPECIES: hypothetical protein [Amycolatopsis]MYW90775.1 hypothetical protein [Amycolatopsis rubida]NEC55758.1 hypothetical protein [Amycolatopsis rubida]OAP26170.1 hypothetical protein A4R44_03548 [Amycolatopsis sp. M39]
MFATPSAQAVDTAAGPASWADRIGRTLLALCAASTLVAFADGITRIGDAPAEYVLTEFWRTTAYLVFAGLWAFLAVAPRTQRGMWELLLLHKTLVTVQAIAYIDLPYAVRTAWIDGLLVVATVVAYVLCRGWYAWRRPEAPQVALDA